MSDLCAHFGLSFILLNSAGLNIYGALGLSLIGAPKVGGVKLIVAPQAILFPFLTHFKFFWSPDQIGCYLVSYIFYNKLCSYLKLTTIFVLLWAVCLLDIEENCCMVVLTCKGFLNSSVTLKRLSIVDLPFRFPAWH